MFISITDDRFKGGSGGIPIGRIPISFGFNVGCNLVKEINNCVDSISDTHVDFQK